MLYELVHWSGLLDGMGKMERDLVMVDEETINNMLSNNPPLFIKVFIFDEEQIINVNNIERLRKVGDTINPQGGQYIEEEVQ